MSTKFLHEYRKKRRTKLDKDAPFPVPVASITNTPCHENFWFQFTGFLQNDSVIVTCSGDIKYLYKMGFFGRGMLSRGAAEFNLSSPYVYMITEPGSEPDIINVMKRRMYLRHKHWHKISNDDQSDNKEDLEFDSDVEYFQEQGVGDRQGVQHVLSQDNQPDVLEDRTDTEINNLNTVPGRGEGDRITEINKNSPLREESTDGDNLSEGDSKNRLDSWDPRNEITGSWTNYDATLGETEMTSKVVSDWDNMEADVDFWGTPSSVEFGNVSKNKSVISDLDLLCQGRERDDDQPDSKRRKLDGNELLSNDVGRTLENQVNNDKLFNNSQEKLKNVVGKNYVKSFKECNNTLNKDFDEVSSVNDVVNDSIKVLKAGIIDNINDDHVEGDHLKFSENTYTVVNNKELLSNAIEESCDKLTCNSDLDNSNIAIKTENTIITHLPNDKPETIKQSLELNSNEFNKELNANMKMDLGEHLGEHMVTADNTRPTLHLETNGEKGSYKETDSRKLHPYCEQDEEDADYLVIDDSDHDDSLTNGQLMKSGNQWKPAMKKDPYPYLEPLILTSEEAYFLSYGLGCLSVMDESRQNALTLKSLWCRFCQKQRFLPCYAAYHYFRSRGWVPKSGVVFGTDFILYKEGPPFFHGSYSVIVKAVYSGTYKPVEEYSNRPLTWTSFSGLHRITEHVAKTLLVCYVIIPPDLTEEEKTSPNCLSKLNISLQRYNRWVASQEREQEKTDMP